MKKIVTLLITFTLIILSAFSFTACGDKEDTTNENVILLNGFEEYKKDFEPMVLLNFFGKVEVNKDAKFVKSGSSSAKLLPTGDKTEDSAGKPTLKQPLNLKAANINVSDITKLSMFTAEVYSDSEADVNMTVQLQISAAAIGDKNYTLKKGWNTILFETHSNIWDISYNASEVTGLLFAFDKPESLETTPTIYIDDIKAYKSQDDFVAYDTELEENEILSFDQLYQFYTVKSLQRFGKFNANISLNTDPIYADSGYSLKMEMLKNDGSLPTESYLGIEIAEKYIQKVGLENYTENDTFSFKIYNDTSAKRTLFFEWFNTDNKIFFKPANITVEPNSWVTKTYTIKEMNTKLGLVSQGTGAAGKIIITYKASSITDNGSIYFDSFKMTKAQAKG